MAQRIVVYGAGSIGCFVGGSLLARGHEVAFIGRERLKQAVAAHGLTIVENRHETRLKHVRVETTPQVLGEAAIILLTMKLGALDGAVAEVARHARPDTLVVTLQNGVGIASRIAPRLPGHRVLSGIVGFNVATNGARFEKATRGEIYARTHPQLDSLGFRLVEDMRPIEWGKLLLNLNNAVNALSGLPLRAELSQRGYRLILAAAIEEALAVADAIGITPSRLGPLPPALLPRVLRAPDWLFNSVMLPLQGVSATARLSMSADYDAGRPTEVGDLNGAVVAAGKENRIPAPVNDALVRLIESRAGHLSASAINDASLGSDRRLAG